MAENACFLALLIGLRSNETCNQGNKYMVMCRTILYGFGDINKPITLGICNLFHEGVGG